MEIIIATNNQGKVREFKAKLKGYDVFSLKDKGIDIEVEEDGKTFEENAIKKARAVADLTGILTMADDSGLEVFALDNAPGIYSARYGGEGLDDKKRYEKLLSEMEGKSNRGARFVSVIALCYPDGRDVTLRGECYGEITNAPKGEGGFGYDPVFYYAPLNQTFGEISLDDKNKISHRARALDKLEAYFDNQNSVIENDKLRLEVKSLGAEIKSLTDKKTGAQLMNTDLESWNFVAPVLFPILGKLERKGYYTFEDNQYTTKPHGFARFMDFSLDSISEDSVTYSLCDSEETLKQYPFKFKLSVTYTLNDNELLTRYTVKNSDNKTIYFNLGAHDAYNLTDPYNKYSLEFEKEEDFTKSYAMNKKRSVVASHFKVAEKSKNINLKNKRTLLNRTMCYFITNPKSSWVQLIKNGQQLVRVHFEKEKTPMLGFWNAKGSSFFCIEPWTGSSESYHTSDDISKKENIISLESNKEYTYDHKAEWFLD